MSQNTKELRVHFNNVWPSPILFPIEERFSELLASKNIQCPFHPVRFNNCESPEFHRFLAAILDALDVLPFRPDRAFEAIWTTLDAEMLNLKKSSGDAEKSRFTQFVEKLFQDFGHTHSWGLLVDFLKLAPLQSCEYIALRIIQALNQPGQHSGPLIARVKTAVGEQFVLDLDNKYGPAWAQASGKARSGVLRHAGALLQLILGGQQVSVGTNKYLFTDQQKLSFCITAMLAGVRNERFHGNTFPSYRSSATKLKSYAGGYFIFDLAYFLMLLVILYKRYDVADISSINDGIKYNSELFMTAFGGMLKE